MKIKRSAAETDTDENINSTTVLKFSVALAENMGRIFSKFELRRKISQNEFVV
jgi:hypothetical protein